MIKIWLNKAKENVLWPVVYAVLSAVLRKI